MATDQIFLRELESPVGKIIAGATAQGCCLLEFQDRGGLDRIKARIQKRHGLKMGDSPKAVLDHLELELNRYFEGLLKTFSVSLDMRGTSFQMAVWRQLLSIPYGETRSYGQVARAVGKPLAHRAVGSANGHNAVAIVVPCHRVIRSDGKLGGYGGGLWRKEYLLDLENRGASL
jgi:AraC family transcriptional regulator of adaptative response/methylated-DNA-[protein]-cysteine methyltransferase